MMTSGRWMLFLIVFATLEVPVATAGLDPEFRKPYDLQVVLHIRKHRQLTDFFADRVEGKLGDSLQAGLGELARVSVVRTHPLLDEVVKRGLEQGLDQLASKTTGKIHFVWIDYVGNQYEIRARQIDGLTGQVSPVVRVARTRDRDFVAAAAARLVAQDFGLVGTLQLPAQNREVRVDFKASALASIGSRVKVGDVFQLIQITLENGKQQPRPVRYTLLQITRAPGEGGQTGTCRIFRPVDADLDTVGIVGYRCIKLNTGSYPLRLRLLEKNDKSLAPVEGTLAISVRRRGFDGEDGTLLNGRVDQGVFDSFPKGKDGIFDNLAFATIELGGGRQARVPVALVTDREEEVVVSRNPSRDNDRFRFQLDRWADGIRLTQLVVNNIFKEVKNLVETKERLQAVQQAREGLVQIRKDLKDLIAQRAILQAEMDKIPAQQRPRLTAYDEQIKRIEEGEKDLTAFLTNVEKIEREENDPKRRDQLAEEKQGELFEKDLELGKAIDVYKKLASAGFDEARLKEKIKQLETLWAPSGAKPEFLKARAFIFEEWTRTLDLPQLNASLPQARQSLQMYQSLHNPLGPKKLLDSTIAHAVRLKGQLDKLNPVNPQDEIAIEEINKLSTELGKLAEDAQAVLTELNKKSS